MTDFRHADAFVVQFRATTNFERGCIEGRVEHVASGRASHFRSMEELMETFARLSKAAPANPQPY